MRDSKPRCNGAAEGRISNERCAVRDARVMEQGGKVGGEGRYTEDTERVRWRKAVAFEVEQMAIVFLVKSQTVNQRDERFGCATDSAVVEGFVVELFKPIRIGPFG
jgi:hypothetical protein